jgi:hypothetical protein
VVAVVVVEQDKQQLLPVVEVAVAVVLPFIMDVFPLGQLAGRRRWLLDLEGQVGLLPQPTILMAMQEQQELQQPLDLTRLALVQMVLLEVP